MQHWLEHHAAYAPPCFLLLNGCGVCAKRCRMVHEISQSHRDAMSLDCPKMRTGSRGHPWRHAAVQTAMLQRGAAGGSCTGGRSAAGRSRPPWRSSTGAVQAGRVPPAGSPMCCRKACRGPGHQQAMDLQRCKSHQRSAASADECQLQSIISEQGINLCP